METIVEPRENFDFSKISLAHPVGVQAGAYFTKIEHMNKPLYIQTTKSATRQGFVKSGKKYYCDLMFTSTDGTIIHWFEQLEERCKQLIFEKKDAWFQGSLDENDVENAFNPLLRVYKSGKFYLLRANVRNKDDDTLGIKVYDEREVEMALGEVTPEREIVSILEIQGIKFTPRNFQIEIEMKQAMALSNDPIFKSCLIKTQRPSQEPMPQPSFEPALEQVPPLGLLQEYNPEPAPSSEPEPEVPVSEQLDLDGSLELEEFDLKVDEPSDAAASVNPLVDIEFEDLTDMVHDNEDDLKEIDPLSREENSDAEPITLKKPNQVYFDLYKKARAKAKEARKNAILAYLEAKNIKKTYMIETLDDSDSEMDAEIEDASESDLEGL